jgi:hypothetical protein
MSSTEEVPSSTVLLLHDDVVYAGNFYPLTYNSSSCPSTPINALRPKIELFSIVATPRPPSGSDQMSHPWLEIKNLQSQTPTQASLEKRP